ncbi:MAG TPA: Zn-dependent hydrolase [Steroidobacteraceae bacterium]|jgi:N-carbamoyl-L-amino-acid hydrolase|nr:Zn-dependent hydrolase [Steroidobacteraceae bacterium]
MKLTNALAACLVAVLPATAGSAKDAQPTVEEARIQQHITELSKFGANPQGGVSRVAFSDADIAGREYIKKLMQDAGLTVRVDTAGNIIGRRDGRNPKLPPILIGSHTDSVPGGGNYDGDVGVIGAIEVAQTLQERGVRLQHPLEVVDFADEEGGTVGSFAMIGHLQPAALGLMTHSGKTIGDGIRALGGDPDRLADAVRKPGDLKAYVELHIEQGAILDESDIDIGVVEGIVGIRWWDVTVEGVANHAGTTPMNRRHDALVSAAELTLAVNRVATTTPGRQVATVGRIRAEPGAPNVIPGKVVLSLEIRDLDAAKIASVFEAVQAEAQKIAQARQTSITFKPLEVSSEPAPTDERVRKIIAKAADSLGLSNKLMPSGAGHDAQEIARIAPTGMIFVPSVGGISHAPREFTSQQDMANGASVLLRTVLAIDGGELR